MNTEELLHRRQTLVHFINLQAPHAIYSPFASGLYNGNWNEFNKIDATLKKRSVDTRNLPYPQPRVSFSASAAKAWEQELLSRQNREFAKLYGVKDETEVEVEFELEDAA